jgi:EAL domain-containing protein (putative c-di-GMP-specific phosphodiesterase class I)
VRELGCNIAQGYHISWPLSEVDFRAWLARESRVAPRLRLLRANP